MTENTGVARVGHKEGEEEKKLSVVEVQSLIIGEQMKIASFRYRPMLFTQNPFPHYTPLRREMFDALAYPILGGVSRSRMGDVFAYVANTTVDLSSNDHLVMFGLGDASTDGNYEHFYHPKARTGVWNMRTLEWEDNPDYDDAIWRSPYGVIDNNEPLKFIMDLAGGDRSKYDDIMQSLAPLVMEKKPDGVIWWIGEGANGKSTLMDAIYRVFPGQLASITVKRLVDGRDTPSLNGNLANVVKESSESRIDDTEIYKSVGTHEDFRVHRFHSQDDILIRGNLHHIFSGNSIPVFADKGHSALRRTFIVPFTQRFDSDPNFEAKTFTPEFFGKLIFELTKYAKILRDQGYKYKWGVASLSAKLEYDTQANNVTEYVQQLLDNGVVAFDSFNSIRQDYENFCNENGYVALGMTLFRKGVTQGGFERVSSRDENNNVAKMYRLKSVGSDTRLQRYNMNTVGIYVNPDFRPAEDVSPPKFDESKDTEEPKEQKQSILEGKW